MNQLPEMHIMLDLETCALEENAAILSICLMPFSLDNDSTVPEPFYQVVDTMSCFMAGMSIANTFIPNSFFTLMTKKFIS